VLFVDQNLLPEVNSSACDYVYNYFLHCTLLTLRYLLWKMTSFIILDCDVHDKESENLKNSNKALLICATLSIYSIC